MTLLAPALGGATQLWSQAAITLGCAALILLAPPRQGPPRMITAALVGLGLLAALSFLPASWFGGLPWRQRLVPPDGLDLPSTLSPQPWLSFENGLLFLTGLVWTSFLITHRWSARRRVLLSLHAAGIALLAAVALGGYISDWLPPFWRPQVPFGFFPNRNQTANVLALGGIITLALAFHEFARQRNLGYLWASTYLLIGVALVICGSRSGILLLLGGSFLWVLWTGWGRQELKRLSLGASVVFLALTLFCTFGGKTLDRFSQMPEQTDGRLLIHQDALRLLSDASWHGIGLGNFSPVFTHYRQAYLRQDRAIHPESDWLWLGIELGWGGVVLVAVALVWWLRRSCPRPEEPDFRLRVALFVCLLGFILHGLVDVSGHRMGSVWPALLYLGLLGGPFGTEPSGRAGTEASVSLAPPESRSWAPAAYRLFGLGLAGVALWWLLSLRPALSSSSSAALAQLKVRLKDWSAFGANAKVVQFATEGLNFAPLDWELYFMRALAEVRAGTEYSRPLADFRRALHLEPNVAELPFIEGIAWLGRQPALALGPWHEALRRTSANNRETAAGRAKAKAALYDRMLALSAPFPTIRDEVRALALNDRALMLVFMKHADRVEFLIELERMLLADPALRGLDAAQRSALFGLWGQKGDRAELERQIAAHPDWITAGWFWVAANHASREEYERACELARRYAPVPPLPAVANTRGVPQLKTTFLLLTNDATTGYALYTAEMQAGHTNEALSILRHVTAQPSSPRYFHFLEAERWMERQAWKEAWQAWLRYIPR